MELLPMLLSASTVALRRSMSISIRGLNDFPNTIGRDLPYRWDLSERAMLGSGIFAEVRMAVDGQSKMYPTHAMIVSDSNGGMNRTDDEGNGSREQ